MTIISYQGRAVSLQPGLSVLDALLRSGHAIPHSCRTGVCQSCLMQATAGTPPEAAQAGLRETLRAQGYFLACRCHPCAKLEVRLPGSGAHRIRAAVTRREPLAPGVLRIDLRPASDFAYRAGQYITLWKDRQTARSYSLASVPTQGPDLELHIRHVPGGQVSRWAHERLKVGDRVWIQGPVGECFYVPGHTRRRLLLAGTGTGLAPLYGILRDALAHGHSRAIHLFHGARNPDGLYLAQTLTALTQVHTNLRYHPCVLDPGRHPRADTPVGPLPRQVLRTLPDLSDWRVYLCGDAEFVKNLRKQAFLAGAGIDDIHADAFTPATEQRLSA